jgi:predicted PurR-regulated permease PerM
MTKTEISVKTIFLIAALILLYQFLTSIEYVIILVVLSYIVMSAIDTLVKPLTKRGVDRNIAIACIYLGIIILITLTFLFLIIPLFQELIELIRQLPVLFTHLVQTNSILHSVFNKRNNFNLTSFNQASQNATQSLLTSNNGIMTVYRTVISVIRDIASFISIIVISLYMLIYKEQQNRFLVTMIPMKYQKKAEKIIGKVEVQLGQWVTAQILLSATVFVLYYLVLSLIHLPYALAIALIAGFMETVPIAGPIISGVIATIITLLVAPASIIYVLASGIIIHELEVHVLVPKIMQKVIGLSPLITIIAILIGAELLGIIGAVLSVPIAAILQILYGEIKQQ